MVEGPRAFASAIDQLLGYTTWRDSRAALMLFVRVGVPTEIAVKATGVIQAHQSFKRMTSAAGCDTFTLQNRDDQALHSRSVPTPVVHNRTCRASTEITPRCVGHVRL